LLGTKNAYEVSQWSIDERSRRILARIKVCSQIAQLAHLKQKSAEAQGALDVAKLEIVRDPDNAANYLQTSIFRTYHYCSHSNETCAINEEMMTSASAGKSRPLINLEAEPKKKSLLDLYAGKLRSRLTNGSPGTPRPSTSTSSLTDEESDDEECVIIAEFGPGRAQANEQEGAKRTVSESPDEGQTRKKMKAAYNP